MGRACPSWVTGSTFHWLSDARGQLHDCPRAEDRQRRRGRLRAERPWLVVGSPPRAWWSSFVALSVGRVSAEEARPSAEEPRAKAT